jgi:hypothetical protein
MATRRNVKKRNMRKTIKQKGGMGGMLSLFKKPTVDKTIAGIRAAKEKLNTATQKKYQAQRDEEQEIKNVKAAEEILKEEALQNLKSKGLNSFEELFNKIQRKNGFFNDENYGDYNYMKQDVGGSGYQQALYVFKTDYKDDKVEVYKSTQ